MPNYLPEKCPKNPIDLVKKWFDLAKNTPEIKSPVAACLSTIETDGYPDGRIVLVRGISDAGLVFYTNSGSPKCKALEKNPKAALTVYWEALDLQIRVQGSCAPVSEEESDAYFATRPRASQIGAWASDQSRELVSREFLKERIHQFEKEFEDQKVTRPSHWQGYRVEPIRIEFWEAQPYRLHHRIDYRKQENGAWEIKRLYP